VASAPKTPGEKKKPATGRVGAGNAKGNTKESEEFPLTLHLTGGNPGLEPFIGVWLSDNGEGFGLVVGTWRPFRPSAELFKLKEPIKRNGTLYPWGIQFQELELDGKTVIRTVGQQLFKTEEEATTALETQKRAASGPNTGSGDFVYFFVRENYNSQNQKHPSWRQDLHGAQMKLLNAQYPETLAVLESLSKAKAELRPPLMESALRAYVVEVARCFKRSRVFKEIPTDGELIKAMAKAWKNKRPFDAVDCELANNWEAAGYSQMKPEDYTQKLNAKLGTTLSVSAMKSRALTKLGLTSKRPEGRPPKDGILP
jgi:hypothetical protein